MTNKILDAYREGKERVKFSSLLEPALKDFARNLILAAKNSMPETEKAHTYASENADIYRAHDAGQEQYKQRAVAPLDEFLEAI